MKIRLSWAMPDGCLHRRCHRQYMVGLQDTGRVNDCVNQPGHIRRNSATQAAGETPVFASRYVNPLHSSVAKRLTILKQTRKSQNLLIDADSEAESC